MPQPTRPLSDFLPMVLPYAAGCTQPLAEANLRLAAIEFCERTRCWRHITTQVLADQGPAIVAPDYATIHEIETAYWGADNDVELTPIQFSQVDPDSYNAASGAFGPPEYITQVSPNTVSVVPYSDGPLRLTLFLKPRSGTEYGTNPTDPLHDKYNVVPEFMFIQHAEAIANGALARILLVQGAAFYDPKRGALYEAKFEGACNAKFTHNIRGQHRAPRRTRMNFF